MTKKHTVNPLLKKVEQNRQEENNEIENKELAQTQDDIVIKPTPYQRDF